MSQRTSYPIFYGGTEKYVDIPVDVVRHGPKTDGRVSERIGACFALTHVR